MSAAVRTRFAPSPTGYLHIGGARTALFNYLVARRAGGKFLLRIEDTDQSRNVAGAMQKLLDDLRWLGLDWDEGPEIGGDFGPYLQSESHATGRYTDIAQRLLEEGHAYYALETREELDAMREAALKAGEKGFRYRRPDNFPSESQARAARDEGRPVVVRFKMPERDFVIRDEILGDVTVSAVELSDFVILKADGWPTYHFAVVLDDHAMDITHVLRGQEHLNNTPNHIALFETLGYALPTFAHLPVILNTAGGKMSKREKSNVARAAAKDALARQGGVDTATVLDWSGLSENDFERWLKKKDTSAAPDLERIATELGITLPEIDIHDFRVSGYLPEVLVNFIALLGWSPGDDREQFTLTELCDAFSLARVGKTNAKFDRDKLLHFNTARYSDNTPERNVAALRDYLAVNPDSPLAGLPDATLERLIQNNLGFRTFQELERKCGALFVADEALEYNAQVIKKVLLKNDRAGAGYLRGAREQLAALEAWTEDTIETCLRTYVEQLGVKFGDVAQTLRVALTGTNISPAIFESLALAGRETTLRRIDAMLAHIDGIRDE